ncbi:hypothetical protein [Lysinibacillus xylanilyticus]|uniref:hypothetical protein n=1 Tax=Lysinibacillus xylanilyticus TaxID=582475 RepID=UPI003D05356F
MNAEQLNAIKERVAKVTPGPWCVGGAIDIHDACGEEVAAVWDGGPDIEFIAHAREDVPALVAEVERLQQQLEKANGLLGWAHDVLDDVHCYETDVYEEISEYFGEDD